MTLVRRFQLKSESLRRAKNFAAFVAQIFDQGIEQMRGRNSTGFAVSLHR